MKVYCVSYDLKGPNRDYSSLFFILKNMGNWWHFLESTWLIASDQTPEMIWSQIAGTVDRTDFVLVIEVRNNKTGWLPKEAWDWINTHVSQ